MRFFDSLVHATIDGSWLGDNRYDASIERLHAALDDARPSRACLVNIAGWQDNDVLESFARTRPDLFVPIAGYDPGAANDVSTVKREVADLARRGFAGIKLHPRLNGYDPLDLACLAAITVAGEHGLAVFLDTLFRQRGIATRHPSDVVDAIANECDETNIVLLHGGGAHLLEMFEMVRMHPRLILDLSFTLLRYQGSSLDLDIRFLARTLDQRLTVGSDFPEYAPAVARNRIMELTADLPVDKRENIMFGNLERLFSNWPGLPPSNNPWPSPRRPDGWL